MEKEKTLNQLRKEIRQKMNSPTIWRKKVSNDKTILVIVYGNREETYELVRKDSFKSITDNQGVKYTRYDAEDMCRGSGMKQIHYQTKLED